MQDSNKKGRDVDHDETIIRLDVTCIQPRGGEYEFE